MALECIAEEFEAATAPRDTLVFSLGALAQAVLRTALNSPDVRCEYLTWIAKSIERAAPPYAAYQLAATGDAEGRLSLYARGVEGEFFIHCRHAEFSAEIALGVELASWRVCALHLSHFDGRVTVAVRFARTLTLQLERLQDAGSREERRRNVDLVN